MRARQHPGVTTVVNGTFSAFLIPVSTGLHWSRAQFSFVLTILSLVGVLCYPLAGRMMDRLGRRPVALAGNVAFGGAIMALSTMPPPPTVVYLLFVLVGATATLPSTVLFARVTSTWFEQRRGLALGLSSQPGVSLNENGVYLASPVALTSRRISHPRHRPDRVLRPVWQHHVSSP